MQRQLYNVTKYFDINDVTIVVRFKKALNIFIKHLEFCDDNDYFEKGLKDAISVDSLNLKVIDVFKYNCIEIDFKEDLENVNKLI
jgi:choline kinase